MISGVVVHRARLARRTAKEISNTTALRQLLPRKDAHGWFDAVFVTSRYLGGGPRVSAGSLFNYVVTVCFADQHVFVFSHTDQVVKEVLHQVFDASRRANLPAVGFRVHALVADVLDAKLAYSLSQVTVEMAAIAQGVERITFFGRSVADDPMYATNAELFVPYRYGVRDPVTGEEIARISRSGRLHVASLTGPMFFRVENTLNQLLLAYGEPDGLATPSTANGGIRE